MRAMVASRFFFESSHSQTVMTVLERVSRRWALSSSRCASSWRNPYYEQVVRLLREQGYEVYDFRNPPHGGKGFHWTDIDENAPNWTFEEYAKGLGHPLTERQFKADPDALELATPACSFFLVAAALIRKPDGWQEEGKKVVVYIPKMEEPELMYKLFDRVVEVLTT